MSGIQRNPLFYCINRKGVRNRVANGYQDKPEIGRATVSKGNLGRSRSQRLPVPCIPVPGSGMLASAAGKAASASYDRPRHWVAADRAMLM